MQSEDKTLRNDDEVLMERLASAVNGPALFSTSWPTTRQWSDDPIKIEEVLYFFDEPLSFTVRSGPFLLLFHKFDEIDGANLFTVSIVDETIIEMLKDNRLSVRGAVAGDMRFMVDLDGNRVIKVWRVRRWNIPDRNKPTAGVCLSDYNAAGREDMVRIFVASDEKDEVVTATLEIREPGFDLQMSPDGRTVARIAAVLSGMADRI